MQRLCTVIRRAPPAVGMQMSSAAAANADAFGVFPREREGNMYSVNWSLTEDGVVPVGDAFRNARVDLLTEKLGAKIEGGKVSVTAPAFKGECLVTEAGADITHEDFAKLLSAQQEYLSGGVELFVEDAGLGAANAHRIGARVVTDSPAMAMIARNLMISTPSRGVDHRARYNGWNKDPRWIDVPEGYFDENDTYVEVNAADQESQGERPIVAFVGGEGSHCAVQFTQANGSIVGANVCAGSGAPVSAIVEAMTEAAAGVINVQQHDCVAVPSCAINKAGEMTLVIGADAGVVAAAQSAGSLYGAYGNVLTPNGVTAMWEGAIGAVPAKAAGKFFAPFVVNGGETASPASPDNMANAPKNIVFFEAGASKKQLSDADAVAKLCDIVGEDKQDAATALLKGVKCSVAGSV